MGFFWYLEVIKPNYLPEGGGRGQKGLLFGLWCCVLDIEFVGL